MKGIAAFCPACRVDFGGKVHGGMAVNWIDQTGYNCMAAGRGACCANTSESGKYFIALFALVWW